MIRGMVATLRSFGPAWRGLCLALRTQRNVRVHAAAAVLVVVAGCWLGMAAWEWCVVALATGLVWTAELLNTAIEALSDRVSGAREEPIRRVKDLAASAVLASAVTAAAVGAGVFLPKIWRLFENVPAVP